MNTPATRSPRAILSTLSLMLAFGATSGCSGSADEGGATTRGDSESSSTLGSSTLDSSTLGSSTLGSSTLDSSTLGSSTGESSVSSGADATGTTNPTTSGSDTTTAGTSTDTGEPAQAGGTIIPLYTYPTDPTWDVVAAAKQAHPEVGIVAIINPNSGPGVMPDPSYDAGITALEDAGVVVIGYVYTSYAARALGDVEADISAYATYYPQLDGILLDEMSNVAGNEAYYAELSAFADALGLGLTVGNPGVSIPESFVDTVDTLFVYENAGLPDPMSLSGWTDAYDRSRFAIIPHSVASLDAGFVSAALAHVGWIYVTDDVLPNPWDTLPPYFDELMLELAAG